MSKLWRSALLFSLLMTSCYNGISTKEIVESAKGDQPIIIKPTISKQTETRVSQNRFEMNDCIGLFMKNNETEKFQLNNSKFEYSKGNIFTSSEEAYYPKNKKESTIYAYYPYAKSIKLSKDESFNVELLSDQSSLAKRNIADMLLAYKPNVKSSKNALSLKFNHLFAKLKITVEISEPYKAEDLLAINPIIRLINCPTKASYNLISEEFSNPNSPKEIKPFLDWKVLDKKLVGTEVIVLPGQIGEEQQIQIEVENTLYKCDFPTVFNVETGTINNITIKYSPSKGFEISQIESDIGDWKDGTNIDLEAKPLLDAIPVGSISFNNSSIIRLENENSVTRAVISKELLKTKDVDCISTVIYPVKEGKINKNEGYVLAVENETYNSLLSATIKWSDSKLEIIKNELPAINYIYINTDGNICFKEPEHSEVITLKDYYLKDNKKDESINYPVVKIGNDIWMKDNLSTKYFNDGTIMASASDKESITAGYTTITDLPNQKLYNMSLLKGKKDFCPVGWKIPTNKDMEKLKLYVDGKFEYLIMNETGNNLTNRTGLSLEKHGAISNGKLVKGIVAIWGTSSDNENLYNLVVDIKNKGYIEMIEENQRKTLSVRCIKAN